MNDFITIGAATPPVLSCGWAGEAADVRRTVPSVRPAKGTGLPTGGFDTSFDTSGVAVVLMGADQVQGATTVRTRAVADQGIPPRWRPVRC